MNLPFILKYLTYLPNNFNRRRGEGLNVCELHHMSVIKRCSRLLHALVCLFLQSKARHSRFRWLTRCGQPVGVLSPHNESVGNVRAEVVLSVGRSGSLPRNDHPTSAWAATIRAPTEHFHLKKTDTNIHPTNISEGYTHTHT